MIQIDELQITMPGNNRDEGSELGRQVAERLAASIPENHGNQYLPEIRLQMQSSTYNDTSMMAERITEQIIRQIKIASL